MATRYGFPKNVWSKGILSTTILFGGCSFTNGLELLDRRKTRYATHVCREFGALQWNEAKVGGAMTISKEQYLMLYYKEENIGTFQ